MMKYYIIAMWLGLVAILTFFAGTESTERKIEQQNGKGLYAPNITYRQRVPVPIAPEQRNTLEGQKLISEIKRIGDKIPLIVDQPKKAPPLPTVPKPRRSPAAIACQHKEGPVPVPTIAPDVARSDAAMLRHGTFGRSNEFVVLAIQEK